MKKSTIDSSSSHRLSLKISEHDCNIESKKKNNKKKIKPQPPAAIDRSIRVLRPKIYMTDSSAFKALVQQLTRSGTATVISAEPGILTEPLQKSPAVDVGIVIGESEETVSLSSQDRSSLLDHRQLVFLGRPSPCQSDDHKSFYGARGPDHYWVNLSRPPSEENSNLISDDFSLMGNLLSYQDLESWLFDLGPHEVSQCDYPLTVLSWSVFRDLIHVNTGTFYSMYFALDFFSVVIGCIGEWSGQRLKPCMVFNLCIYVQMYMDVLYVKTMPGFCCVFHDCIMNRLYILCTCVHMSDINIQWLLLFPQSSPVLYTEPIH